MIPSDKCIALIKGEEGCKLKAYPDPATGGAPWTIAYGHTANVKQGDVCTQSQADAWLTEEAVLIANKIQSAVKVPLKQNQLDALTSLVYNIGMGNFLHSTMLKLLNAGDYNAAAKEFLKWNHANGKVMDGLSKRREDERELFVS